MSHSINRRQFIKASALLAGAVAAPQIVPSSVLGADGAVAPSNRITLGCIGVGGMGTGNMQVFAGLPDCRVVAVCDVMASRRQKAKDYVDSANRAKDCAMVADWRELVARKDVDALMIAPWDHWHALIATAAARAGKDMYMEKPMGVSLEEGQKILAEVRRNGRVFQAGTWQRSQRKFRHACEVARNGYLGKIHTIEVSTEGPQYRPGYKGSLDPQPAPPRLDWKMLVGPAEMRPYNPGRHAWPDWYLIYDWCIGFIVNWGVHHLDIALWGMPELATEPFEVECQATYRNEGFTDNVNQWKATYTYASGLKMIFADQLQMKLGCKFIGDKGWIHVDRSGIWAEPESLLSQKLKDDDLRLQASTHHHQNFLDCVRSRKDPVSNVDATHKASYMGLLADISGRLKTKLKWDPKQEQFIGNDEANKMLTRPMHNGWKL